MSDAYARFWAIDLHVHTEASLDVRQKKGAASAQEIVECALGAGLDAIAITDHNTCAGIAAVVAAAEGTALTVLPGVEISTTEGHLLSLFEVGTPMVEIEDLLVGLGFTHDDQGRLDLECNYGFLDAASKICAIGGIAIPAHVDAPKGLLKLSVPGSINRVLVSPDIAAVEITDQATSVTIETRSAQRSEPLGCVQSSDCHVALDIGGRRTWFKAGAPDLRGLKHALGDPELRIRLEEPDRGGGHPTIKSVAVNGGFLDNVVTLLSPDLNCILGGTGTGKSLTIECIRFALDQQLEESQFPHIAEDVAGRLSGALGQSGVVTVELSVGGNEYRVTRVYDAEDMPPPNVEMLVGDVWIEASDLIEVICPIAAFSQGQVLEISRNPTGRMTLVDVALDLREFEKQERALVEKLRSNTIDVMSLFPRLMEVANHAEQSGVLEDRVKVLGAVFDQDVVRRQASWEVEKGALGRVQTALEGVVWVDHSFVPRHDGQSWVANLDLGQELGVLVAEAAQRFNAAGEAFGEAKRVALEKLGSISANWAQRSDVYKAELQQALSELSADQSLPALQQQLARAQSDLVEAQAAREELVAVRQPEFDECLTEREGLLDGLRDVRRARREARAVRADQLESRCGGWVKLKISQTPDSFEYQQRLRELAVGARLRQEDLLAIELIYPFKLVRNIFRDDLDPLVSDDLSLTAIRRFRDNLDAKDLWLEFLNLQSIPLPDRLGVKFKKSDSQNFVALEKLAHGERCTAILVVLLADGDQPLIVDQPEDAVHAPWMEDYLVERLRNLRGERQYLFVTRSPAIVISADAEQLVTMRAASDQGTIEAAGSLDRFDLNALALHHLEGGAVAVRRRTQKLSPSIEASA